MSMYEMFVVARSVDEMCVDDMCIDEVLVADISEC
jgi:hypothetical protein